MRKVIPPDELLKDLACLNGNQEVIQLLRRFIKDDLLMTDGLILIKTAGKHVNIDGTRFNELEAVWALAKAQHELLNKGLSFD